MTDENVKISFNDTTFEVSKADITKAMEAGKDGQITIKSDGHLIFTKEDDEKRIFNLSKPAHEEGKKAALEMKAKEWRNKYPDIFDETFDPKSWKDMDAALEHYAEKKVAGAKIPANEKITQYEKDLKILRENLQKEDD